MTMYSRDAADRLLLVARRAAETVKIESAHLAELAETIIALYDRLAAPPRIIRTSDELAALDPDTLVAMNPITKGHATAYVWSADTALRVNLLWHAPLVIIATGDTVRAARQALEEA
ncbi:hypothetical protein ACEE18_05765 [Corynebacterium freneyi]